jgi:hypothetical protein
MNLPVPEVGIEPGPNYANDVNNSLGIIDQHNHAFGSGVQVTPTGLNINTDLTINSNNLTALRSIRFTPQSAPLALITDIGCIYESGVDLWYNDGLGNQVRITASGGVAGSPGSISGLVSPASASYNPGSSTFVWQSNTNTAANMDAGSYIFRNLTANSDGITVSAPAALSSNYSIIWPTLPVSATSFLAIDSSGNMSATVPVIAGITTSNIAPATILGSNIAAHTITPLNMSVNYASSGTGLTFTGSGTSHQFPILQSGNITTNGNPVMITFQWDRVSSPAVLNVGGGAIFLYIYNDAGGTVTVQLAELGTGIYTPTIWNFIDYSVLGIPGTYNYGVGVAGQTSGTNYTFLNFTMIAREL